MLTTDCRFYTYLVYFLAVFSLLLTVTAHGEELTIFDVRKNLPLTDEEPVFRDFYINGGSEQGLRSGMIVTVTRRVTLYDSYQNKSPGDLMVDVARVKIIHVQKGLSVARLHSDFSRRNIPLLEEDFVMVGDKLDLHSARMGGKGSKSSQKTDSPNSPQKRSPSHQAPRAPSEAPDPVLQPDMALSALLQPAQPWSQRVSLLY